MTWWKKWKASGLIAGTALLASVPAAAAPVAMIPGPDQTDSSPSDDTVALPYLQCVPYARQVSGIQLFGDAHTWWDQAAGRYDRGSKPRVGAVMSFHSYGAMRLGHVATVSRVLDSRTVLLRHANWSPINGVRGQKENDVRAIDVSDANDWSEVRVWYAPIQGLGTTRWPVDGFIYNRPPARQPGLGGPLRLAGAPGADPRIMPLAARAQPARGRIDADFLKGVAMDPAPAGSPRRTFLAAKAANPPVPVPARTTGAPADDPIGRIIASRTISR